MFRNPVSLQMLSVGLICVAGGCSAEAPSGNSGSIEGSADSTLAITPIVLQTLDWDGVQDLVRQHQGKVVVLNIWTTTCGKCVEEFPHFVELQRIYSTADVALIAVNCDYDGIKSKPPDYYRPQVLQFLTEHQATFDNVMLNTAFIDFLELIDLSSTPAIQVYDRNGQLIRRFSNDDATSEKDEYTLDDVATVVDRLLTD